MWDLYSKETLPKKFKQVLLELYLVMLFLNLFMLLWFAGRLVVGGWLVGWWVGCLGDA